MSIDNSLVECACGKTSIELKRQPICCAICHCDDCQEAAEELKARGVSAPVMDAYRGTAYVLQRKDRYAIVRGKEHLEVFKLREDSPIARMIAACCNSPMFLAFDNAQHWISVYRDRMKTPAPVVVARVATKFIDASISLPGDAPSYKTFPFSMVVALLKSRLMMAIGR